MVGLFVWFLLPIVVVLLMRGVGWVPREGSGAVAATLVLIGFVIGKAVNEFIAARFPRFDKWNCP